MIAVIILVTLNNKLILPDWPNISTSEPKSCLTGLHGHIRIPSIKPCHAEFIFSKWEQNDSYLDPSFNLQQHPKPFSYELPFVSICKQFAVLLTTNTHNANNNCFYLSNALPQPWDCCNTEQPSETRINSLRPRRNRRHFADDIFKCIFLNDNELISLRISLKFVPKVRINNIPSLVQIIGRRRPDDKPLSEPIVVIYIYIYTDAYVLHSASMS